MTEQWEVRWVEARDTGGDPTLPAGWEPFAAVFGGLWLRRRVVPAVTRSIPSRALSAKERAAREIANRELDRMKGPIAPGHLSPETLAKIAGRGLGGTREGS